MGSTCSECSLLPGSNAWTPDGGGPTLLSELRLGKIMITLWSISGACLLSFSLFLSLVFCSFTLVAFFPT